MSNMIPIPDELATAINDVVLEAESKGALPALAREALNSAWNADEYRGVKSFIHEVRDVSGDAFYMAKMTRQGRSNKGRWKIELEVKQA